LVPCPSLGAGGIFCLAGSGEINMKLPSIDLSSLPDLDTVTGLFGSLLDTSGQVYSDDTIVVMMVFLYEIVPPSGLL
jgi:hypothetical protein